MKANESTFWNKKEKKQSIFLYTLTIIIKIYVKNIHSIVQNKARSFVCSYVHPYDIHVASLTTKVYSSFNNSLKKKIKIHQSFEILLNYTLANGILTRNMLNIISLLIGASLMTRKTKRNQIDYDALMTYKIVIINLVNKTSL